MEPTKKKVKKSELDEDYSQSKTSKETKLMNALNKLVEMEGLEHELKRKAFEEFEYIDDNSTTIQHEDGCDSNQAITFKIIRNENDLLTNDHFNDDHQEYKKPLEFHPVMSHQLFEEEKIIGYTNLKINIYFTKSLYCYLNITYDSKTEDATDVKRILAIDELDFQFIDMKAVPMYFPFTENLDEFKSKLTQKFLPKGEQIDVYEKDGRIFEIYRATMQQIGGFHKPLQFLSLFFIEGTSYIDEHDENWEFFLIFEKVKDEVTHEIDYIISGYASIYPFYFLKKEGEELFDGRRLRISQVLILPPFQKQGHGRKLLHAIYRYACKGYKENISVVGYNALDENKTYEPRECYEITIENPSEELHTLRTKVDIEICTPLFKGATRSINDTTGEKETYEQFRKRVKPLTKLSDTQLRTCFEVLWLKHLNENVKTTKEERNEYKLFVKKRLFHQCDLSVIENVKERKEKLEELYNEQIEEYRMYLNK
ncbi:hypothetical protein ABK040_008283 [Willaertia magna]